MKVFVSYRRDDTAGRAGRLFDVLASRYGARNVFQDVASASPGDDFVEGLDAAIARSEVVLVVIGPSWLTSRDAAGDRRIDRADDFVRMEVRAALAADIPVVPVLVDGAEIPAAENLPGDLAALARRQAAVVRDESWHQDVESLLRRLEGEEPAFDSPRRRWVGVLAGAVLVTAAVAATLIIMRGGDSGTSDEIGTCPQIDETWTSLDVADTTPIPHSYGSPASELEIAVVGAYLRPREGGGTTYLVDVEVTNRNDPQPDGEDSFYFSAGDIHGLVVDGFDQGGVECMHTNTDPMLEPGRRTVGTVGFDTEIADPAGLPVMLDAFDDLDLVVMGPAES